MADGYFRTTGRVGVATVTCGPGLTQVGTSLMAAVRNRTAMVLVIGEIPPGEKNKLQSMDQRRFVEACSTRYHTITKPDNVGEEIAEAFYTARVQRCPVVLNLPMDIQEHSFDWDFEYRPSTAFLPKGNDVASDEALAPIVEALMRAERPVIIAGRGARNAAARDAIVELADRVGALLATSLQAKGFFAGHDYDIGIAGAYASAPSEAAVRGRGFRSRRRRGAWLLHHRRRPAVSLAPRSRASTSRRRRPSLAFFPGFTRAATP